MQFWGPYILSIGLMVTGGVILVLGGFNALVSSESLVQKSVLLGAALLGIGAAIYYLLKRAMGR